METPAAEHEDGITVIQPNHIAFRAPSRRKPQVSDAEWAKSDLRELFNAVNRLRQEHKTWRASTVKIHVDALSSARDLVFEKRSRDYPEAGDHTWLLKASRVVRKLSKRYANSGTHRNILNAAAIACRHLATVKEDRSYRKAAAVFLEAFDEAHQELQARRDTQEMTPREEALWMNWPDIVSSVRNYVAPLWGVLKRQETLDGNDLRVLQDLLVLTAYTKVEPARGDWRKVRIDGFDPRLHNHLIFEDSSAKAVFVDHKTSKSHGSITLLMDAEFKEMAKLWRDQSRCNHLFINTSGQEFSAAAFSQWQGRIFEKATGKKLTSTILRKSFATNSLVKAGFPSTQTMKDLRASAQRMGHTLSTHTDRYRVVTRF